MDQIILAKSFGGPKGQMHHRRAWGPNFLEPFKGGLAALHDCLGFPYLRLHAECTHFFKAVDRKMPESNLKSSRAATDWAQQNDQSKDVAFHILLELFYLEALNSDAAAPTAEAAFWYLQLAIMVLEDGEQANWREKEEHVDI